MRIALCVFFLFSSANTSLATELGFRFRGTVTQSFADPYGQPVPVFSSVNGRFIFDSTSVVTHNFGDCDCVGYRQQITGGFFADFGETHIRADDFVIEIANDFPQPRGAADIITVRFADDYVSPLTAPLNVDGAAHDTGQFSLNFIGDTTLFSSTDLPSTIDLDDSPADFNLLTETTLGVPDLLFSLSSLDSVPVIAGDYNSDGSVDASDYELWSNSFGSTSDLSADGNRDGVVDAADFTVLQGANPSTSVVPETIPSFGWHLLFLAFACRVQHNIARAKTCRRKE